MDREISSFIVRKKSGRGIATEKQELGDPRFVRNALQWWSRRIYWEDAQNGWVIGPRCLLKLQLVLEASGQVKGIDLARDARCDDEYLWLQWACEDHNWELIEVGSTVPFLTRLWTRARGRLAYVGRRLAVLANEAFFSLKDILLNRVVETYDAIIFQTYTEKDPRFPNPAEVAGNLSDVFPRIFWVNERTGFLCEKEWRLRFDVLVDPIAHTYIHVSVKGPANPYLPLEQTRADWFPSRQLAQVCVNNGWILYDLDERSVQHARPHEDAWFEFAIAEAVRELGVRALKPGSPRAIPFKIAAGLTARATH